MRLNILVYGTMIGPGGISHHTREFTKELNKYHNVKFINFNIPSTWKGYTGRNVFKKLKELENVHHSMLFKQSLRDEKNELKDYKLSGYKDNFKPDVHLVMAEANHYYYYREFKEGIKIAYFPWETTKIHDVFFNQLKTFDYVWTPSEWQKNILINQGISENKIYVVPEGVDTQKYYPSNNKNDKFTFLHVGTWEFRKSTYEIVKSFLHNFSENKNVQLKLSIKNKFRPQDDDITTFKKYKLPLDKNVILLDVLSEEDFISEIRNADVYLSCARGEGWNLPLMQSMASGVPSIYSKVGGQLEFTKGSLLGCDYVKEIPVDHKTYVNGQEWYWYWGEGYPGNLYEPNFQQFNENLIEVYKNYDFYKQKSIEYSNYIHDVFSWEKCVKTAVDLIEDYTNKK